MFTKEQKKILSLMNYLKIQEWVLADLRLFNDEAEKWQNEAEEIWSIHQFLKW